MSRGCGKSRFGPHRFIQKYRMPTPGIARSVQRPKPIHWVLLLLILPASSHMAFGQAPLFYANENTTVRKISIKFVEGETLDEETLLKQIATSQPSTFDRIKRFLPFVSPTRHRFDAVTLQKDVVRLRRYYREHGFLFAEIDYPASQLDTTKNRIHVIFSITEGPPLILQDFGFYDPDGRYALDIFPPALRERWVRFRDRLTLQLGQRYTDSERIRIQDNALNWLKDNGFAFATVKADAVVDSVANTADVRYVVDPGPLGRVSEIQIEGNESVGDRVLTRELPFKVGDRFSNRKVSQGQREIFGLNLFRVALADIPEQPADSSVIVRYRVREAKARFLTGQTGYSRQEGVTIQGEWRHRNFFGGARNSSVNATALTGYLGSTSGDNLALRRFSFSTSIRQPYLFSAYFSGSVSPFIQWERDPNLRESSEALGINRRDFGFSTTVIYQRMSFRPFTLNYTFVRSLQFTAEREDASLQTRDLFNKSVISFNGTIGKLDNFLNPRRGYLLRPFIESAGSVLGSAVEYVKLGTEVQGFLPLTRKISVGARIQAGRVWPLGRSERRLDAGDQLFEDRFDPILFYAGGALDVRGWDTGLLGAKTARPARADDSRIVYEAAGGRSKIALNVEVRQPFPGLGSAWRLATFFDAGQVSGRETTRADGTPTIVDSGRIRLADFRYAVGTGIRYRTPVGYLRFDIAYKLNPSTKDLLSPADALAGRDAEKFLRRFNIHLSIGQSF